MIRKSLLISLIIFSLQIASGSNNSFFPPAEQGESRSTSSPIQQTSPRLAIKTNLLYDAALLPSIEAEYYFARRWSVNADFQMAWWHFESKDYFYQLWAVSPELRFWLKNDATYRGHFASLYAMTGTYDLKFSEQEGYHSDNAWSTGIGWGYYLPVSRKLALEFALSAGYITTLYEKYRPSPSDPHHYIYDGTSRFTFFGPTKVKVCLVWRFNL